MIPPRCRALIFDMDGVLWHSGVAHAEAYRQALLSEGLLMPDYATLAGRRTDEVMRDIVKTQKGSIDAEQVERLTLTKQTLAYQILSNSLPLADGCVDTLCLLAKTYRLVLASSASRRSVQLFLTKCGDTHLFENVLCGEDVRAAKPAPDLYLMALKVLQLPSVDCVVIEDALRGIEAAQRAGISTIAVTGTHRYEDLAKSSALAVIDRLGDLCPK